MPQVASVPPIRCNSYQPYSQPDGRRNYEVALTKLAETDLKMQLCLRLNSGRLFNMPAGFPFHYTLNGYHYPSKSYSPYEFLEDISNRKHSQHSTATISFHGPSLHDKTQYFTWQVSLSSGSPHLRHPQNKIIVAHVQIHADVTNTSYWNRLTVDPGVVLRALALSLEAGTSITVQRLDPSMDAVVYVSATHGIRNPHLIVRQ